MQRVMEPESKNPEYNRGFREQRDGRFSGQQNPKNASYHAGAAQAHNIGYTRERAMYRAEDELLPRHKPLNSTGHVNLHDKESKRNNGN